MSKAFFESFDHGVGALDHTWGNGIDTSVKGQVTIRGDSGIMEKPWGKAAGHGYGTFSVKAKMSADVQGPAALLWPGDDRWPGPEYDIVEVIHGKAYGTVHWNNNGRDAYTTRTFHGVDETKVHTYTLDWKPGKIAYYVDGKWMGEVKHNIGKDHANGGVDSVFSIMNRDFESKHSFITAYEVSYKPHGGSRLEAEPIEEGSWSNAKDYDFA